VGTHILSCGGQRDIVSKRDPGMGKGGLAKAKMLRFDAIGGLEKLISDLAELPAWML
jgi:hypothetical protein